MLQLLGRDGRDGRHTPPGPGQEPAALAELCRELRMAGWLETAGCICRDLSQRHANQEVKHAASATDEFAGFRGRGVESRNQLPERRRGSVRERLARRGDGVVVNGGLRFLLPAGRNLNAEGSGGDTDAVMRRSEEHT